MRLNFSFPFYVHLGLRKCTDQIKLLWMETLELVYRRMISKLIRYKYHVADYHVSSQEKVKSCFVYNRLCLTMF